MCSGNGHRNQEEQRDEQRTNDEQPIREPLISWPLERNENSFVWCCQACFYPIARLGTIQLLRRNLNIFGLLLSGHQLLTEDFAADYGRTFARTWMCRVFCFNCGRQLSFDEATVPAVLRDFDGDENQVILNFQLVTIGSTNAMAQRFIPIAR